MQFWYLDFQTVQVSYGKSYESSSTSSESEEREESLTPGLVSLHVHPPSPSSHDGIEFQWLDTVNKIVSL